MKCISLKANGEPCKAEARKGATTCRQHDGKEFDLPAKDQEVSAKSCGEVTFVSLSKNYGFVVIPRTADTSGKRADFVNGRFATEDQEIIAVLRDHIRKNPNNRFLFEA